MATISLCMIAKDEEQSIGRAINSVKPFVDEVIVVDTGSADNTAGVARQLGASVYHYKWVDDFSKARNFSISKASSDWILVLDADEELLEGDASRLAKLADGNCDAYMLIQKNFSNTQAFGFVPEKKRGFAGFYPSFIIRMFKTGKGIQFEGMVHETVDDSLSKWKANVVLVPELPVYHYPELKGAEYFRQKQLKYAELMEKNLGSFKNKAKAYADIGLVHYRFKADYAKAAEYFRKSLELKPDAPLVLNDLAAAYVQLGDIKKAGETFAQSMRLKPSASTLFNIGLVHQKMGDNEAAAISFEESARLGHPRAKELLERAAALRAANGKKG